VRIRGKVTTDNGIDLKVEFEIPDDSPEARSLREGMSFSIAPPPPAPEQCTNLYCSQVQPHDLSPECPLPPGTSGWKSGGGAGQWNG
jgi:hypothetical protein